MMNSQTKQYDYEMIVDDQLKNFISSAIASNELDSDKFKNYVNELYKTNMHVNNISAFLCQELKKVDLKKFKKKKVSLLLHEFENVPFLNFKGTREEKYLVIKLFEYGMNELNMSASVIKQFANAVGEVCIKKGQKNWDAAAQVILRSKSFVASNISIDELKKQVAEEIAFWDSLFPEREDPKDDEEGFADDELPF